ncbi:MAG: biotin transporter BioY [Gemmatimonadota bacterium]
MKSETGTAPGSTAGPARTVAPPRVLIRLVAVLTFAAATAVGARISVPLPGTAVPFTLQVVAVLLAGLVLGPRLGAASQALYVGAGAAGLPVFAAGGGAAYLLGPTGGYLIAYPAAAAVAGYVAGASFRSVRLAIAGAVGLGVIHLGGAAWLSVTTDPGTAIHAGVLPFLPGDLLKVALVALLAGRLGAPTRRRLT